MIRITFSNLKDTAATIKVYTKTFDFFRINCFKLQV